MRLDSRQSIQPRIRSIDGLSIRYAESELRARPVTAEYLHERLPKSKLDLIAALHVIWEDAAGAYAALVTNRWGGGYVKAGLLQ
jgi:hypothetical protein